MAGWIKHPCTDKYRGSDAAIQRPPVKSSYKFNLKGQDEKIRDVYFIVAMQAVADEQALALTLRNRRGNLGILITLPELARNAATEADIREPPR